MLSEMGNKGWAVRQGWPWAWLVWARHQTVFVGEPIGHRPLAARDWPVQRLIMLGEGVPVQSKGLDHSCRPPGWGKVAIFIAGVLKL